ncbi:hypothetical protein NC653_001484 [Populus alba x Populus x berolinensis]|uniref:Uncharacterized protein n=1 Tax=Populus alba x Populus x berolinensis TaxID=444605 RepID=A0AAD6WG30_9ROSI|nr:hypothetical protein NC653_001484 [Populus alba x Populus x berolinensis]
MDIEESSRQTKESSNCYCCCGNYLWFLAMVEVLGNGAKYWSSQNQASTPGEGSTL